MTKLQLRRKGCIGLMLALSAIAACTHRVPDGIHRYRHPQEDTAPATCWADSHPNVEWAARADGQCFMADAPWKNK
jgi:hypothetical protein